MTYLSPQFKEKKQIIALCYYDMKMLQKVSNNNMNDQLTEHLTLSPVCGFSSG